MLSCTETRELLPLWAGNDLPEDDLAAVDAHLAACGPCHSAATRWRVELSRVTAVLRDDPGPDLDPQALDRAIRAAARTSGHRSGRRFWPVAGPLAAVLAIFLLWQGTRTPDPGPGDHFQDPGRIVSWEELQVVFGGCLNAPVDPEALSTAEGAGLIAVLSPHPSGQGYILADCIESPNLLWIRRFPWLKQRLDRYRRAEDGERNIVLAVCMTGDMSRATRHDLQEDILSRFGQGV